VPSGGQAVTHLGLDQVWRACCRPEHRRRTEVPRNGRGGRTHARRRCADPGLALTVRNHSAWASRRAQQRATTVSANTHRESIGLRLGRRLAGAGGGVRTRAVSGGWLRDTPVLGLVTAGEWLIRRAGLSGCEPATLATVLFLNRSRRARAARVVSLMSLQMTSSESPEDSGPSLAVAYSSLTNLCHPGSLQVQRRTR